MTTFLRLRSFLSEHGVPIWIRHVVVPGITDKEEYLFQAGRVYLTAQDFESA